MLPNPRGENAMSDRDARGNRIFRLSRRKALKGLAVGLGALAIPGKDASAAIWESFSQKNFRKLKQEEIRGILARLEKEYSEKYKKAVKVKATEPIEGVLYGYGLDLSRCIGCRRGGYGGVTTNNPSPH